MTTPDLTTFALRKALRLAADDLDVRITIDGAQMVDANGQAHGCVAILDDFGSRMHILKEYDATLAQIAVNAGHGYTVLGGGYSPYDRSAYIELLSDWGWSGEGTPPSWYSEPV